MRVADMKPPPGYTLWRNRAGQYRVCEERTGQVFHYAPREAVGYRRGFCFGNLRERGYLLSGFSQLIDPRLRVEEGL